MKNHSLLFTALLLTCTKSIFTQNYNNPNNINFTHFNASQGFKMIGVADERTGFSVSTAGDINGDGISDIIVGAPTANPKGRKEAGTCYVVYGKKGGYSEPLELSNLEPHEGFVIQGAKAGDWLGNSVNSAGDFNGDGINDIILGAYSANRNNMLSPGVSYIIYGQHYYPTSIDLAILQSSQGFAIQGAQGYEIAGNSVDTAGDFNGDGIDDVIIGAPGATPQGRASAGVSYVIYGKKGGYPETINLSNLSPSVGIPIQGASAYQTCGQSVSSADVNGDGISDVIVGCPADRNMPGSSYVIYGKKGGYTGTIDLKYLSKDDGFLIEGAEQNDQCGTSVSGTKDVNGDKIDDMIIGAPNANLNTPGIAYVIYGKAGGYTNPIYLASLNATLGFTIQGNVGGAVSTAGDINNDGFNDIIASGSDNDYLVYGKKGGYSNPIKVAHLNDTLGFTIFNGSASNSAGDVNGDQINDIIVGENTGGSGAAYVIYGSKKFSPIN